MSKCKSKTDIILRIYSGSAIVQKWEGRDEEELVAAFPEFLIEGPMPLSHTPPPHLCYNEDARQLLARATIIIGGAACYMLGRDPAEFLIESLRDATRLRGQVSYRDLSGQGPEECFDAPQVLQYVAEIVGIDLADDHQAEVFVDYCQRCLESYEDYFLQASDPPSVAVRLAPTTHHPFPRG